MLITIQKDFMRVHSRDHLGDHNEFLIPDAFKECYPDEVSDEVHIDESSSEETS